MKDLPLRAPVVEFHVVAWQTTSKHCPKKRAARAPRLFFFIQPIKSLICGVVVDVAVVKKLPIIIKEMMMATSTTTLQINDFIGWMKRNNRVARAARLLVQFLDVGPDRETWNFRFWGSAGARFSKVPELFGPKRPFVKLRPAQVILCCKGNKN